MSSGSNGQQRYLVSYSVVIQEQFQECQRQASDQGRGADCLRAVRTILRRLAYEPFEFGEPVYRLTNLRLQIRTAVVVPLSVDFGVSEERRVVYIKSVKLLPVG